MSSDSDDLFSLLGSVSDPTPDSTTPPLPAAKRLASTPAADQPPFSQSTGNQSDTLSEEPSWAAETTPSSSRAKKATLTEEKPQAGIVQIDVSDEMRTSFLEYAYSVIYARALPDARDGLKPVQRRIVHMMNEMGLDPAKGHVKSSRVVGEVMGKLHPHGDSAIYEALVRLAQDFNLRLPLVDGHGNFGSLDDGPAASRYTEARMAPPALDMVKNLKEDVVEFVPNYDNQFTQPEVLPAGFPNLLVNGTSGIAVGMATNIPSHNLGETIQGAIYLLRHPQAETEELMRFIPGPDLPGGGIIVGLDGVRDAYRSGRGIFKTRAKTSIERVTARKMGIVVTELPYMVGPERVIEKIKDAVNRGKIKGISAVTNLTDREHDLRLVIEVKNGFNPKAVLSSLFKQTPMEDSFGINAVALVDGQPQTMGLKQMLQVFLDHRMEIVWRRSHFRLRQRKERLHLVAGLLIAVLDIDDVIQIIRSSNDVSQARARLMEAFDLDQVQAEHILSLQLRRLTKFSRLELEKERDQLQAEIAELEALIASEDLRRDLVAQELQEVGARLGTPRRTVLLEDEGEVELSSDAPLEIPDDPCTLMLGPSGLLGRFALRGQGSDALAAGGDTQSNPHTFTDSTSGDSADKAGSETDWLRRNQERLSALNRQNWDGIRSTLQSTNRAQVGLLTSAGRLYKFNALDVAGLQSAIGAPSLQGGIPVTQLIAIGETERPIALLSLAAPADTWWIATKQGTIKRVRIEILTTADSFEIISLDPNDEVIAGGHCSDEAELVLISSAAQLLRTAAGKIRPQGRLATGVAGMKLSQGAKVIAAQAIEPDQVKRALVTTVVGNGVKQTSIKVTPFDLYPIKGRGGQGVRAQRFLKGETVCMLASVSRTPNPLDHNGAPLALPQLDGRRDGSGTPIGPQISYLC